MAASSRTLQIHRPEVRRAPSSRPAARSRPPNRTPESPRAYAGAESIASGEPRTRAPAPNRRARGAAGRRATPTAPRRRRGRAAGASIRELFAARAARARPRGSPRAASTDAFGSTVSSASSLGEHRRVIARADGRRQMQLPTLRACRRRTAAARASRPAASRACAAETRTADRCLRRRADARPSTMPSRPVRAN